MWRVGRWVSGLAAGGRALVRHVLHTEACQGRDALAQADAWAREAVAARNPAGALVARAKGVQRGQGWHPEYLADIALALRPVEPEPAQQGNRERVLGWIEQLQLSGGLSSPGARAKARQLLLAWR